MADSVMQLPSRIPQRVVLASNGFADGNAEAMAEFLIASKIEMLCIVKHPLEAKADAFHQIQVFEYGKLSKTRRWALPCRPPLTYIFDLMVPPLISVPKADVWIGFGNLNTLRGLQAKLFGRVRRVIYDCVDFSPARFGERSLLTSIYDLIDLFCCKKSDLIWPISEKSHLARMEKHALVSSVPVYTVPMGAWLGRVPVASGSNLSDPRIVFLGHLLEKQGLQAVIQSLRAVLKVIPRATLHIVGGGPYKETLEIMVREEGLSDVVVFHGFVKDHHAVEEILATGAVAVATYIPEMADFTAFADPGKLKAYLGAGLPIVLTNVSPNAAEIAEKAGSLLTEYDPDQIAKSITEVLSDHAKWESRHRSALAYIKEFDWNIILGNAFSNAQSSFGELQ